MLIKTASQYYTIPINTLGNAVVTILPEALSGKKKKENCSKLWRKRVFEVDNEPFPHWEFSNTPCYSNILETIMRIYIINLVIHPLNWEWIYNNVDLQSKPFVCIDLVKWLHCRTNYTNYFDCKEKGWTKTEPRLDFAFVSRYNQVEDTLLRLKILK